MRNAGLLTSKSGRKSITQTPRRKNPVHNSARRNVRKGRRK